MLDFKKLIGVFLSALKGEVLAWAILLLVTGVIGVVLQFL